MIKGGETNGRKKKEEEKLATLGGYVRYGS